MKIKNSIPAAVIGAASSMLNTWCEELTPTALVKAIESYEDGITAADGVEKMLTRKQAAKMLQTSLPTIYRLNKEGRIRFVHFGRRNVRIPLADIQEMLTPQASVNM